jgi:hypothetical protein
MRYIKVPEPLQLKSPQGETIEAPFPKFLREMLLDPQFAKNYKTLKIAAAIDKALDKANGVVALENEHWQLLKKVIEEPTGGYMGGVGPQILPFLSVVIEATDEELEVESPA